MNDFIGWVIRMQYGEAVLPGHLVGGYPQFDGWPRYDSVTHQSVHIDWLQRAWYGGLRLMVMLAVNNEFMCGLPGMLRALGRGCGDMEAVDLQLQAAVALEAEIDKQSGGPGRGWYRIVREPNEAFETIRDGKLAVVLGIEVDYLFGSYVYANLTPGAVHASVQKYYDLGVRHVFPIHFADNLFGGTAFQNGLQGDGVAIEIETPFGSITTPYVLLTDDGRGLGYAYRGGRMNRLGLTGLGRVLITSLMERGMLFDVDHMSFRTRSAVLDVAEEAGYPVISGHSGYIDVCRGDKRHEGQLTNQEVARIRRLGGMVAPIIRQCNSISEVITWIRPDGTSIPHVCAPTDNSFAQAYLYAVENMQGASVAIGTDFNGFAGLPAPRSGREACHGGKVSGGPILAGLTYPFQSSVTAAYLDRSQIGQKTYDINNDGIAHIGMLPDMVGDLQAMGVRPYEIEPLLTSADSYVALWRRAVANGTKRARSAIPAYSLTVL